MVFMSACCIRCGCKLVRGDLCKSCILKNINARKNNPTYFIRIDKGLKTRQRNLIKIINSKQKT